MNPETGKVIWTVYSDKGYLYNNKSVYPTADGGLVFVGDVRNLADKTETTLLRMVGADGQKTEVNYTPAGNGRTSVEGGTEPYRHRPVTRLLPNSTRTAICSNS